INYSVGTGDWLDAESFAQAGLVLIWGSNTLVTNRHLWPFVEQARTEGAPLFVVDPLRTRTAQRADGHLAPYPGTDGALALGLSRAAVDRGGADERFLTERTEGWNHFEARLAFWDLHRTSTVTGVPAADIERLAEAIVAAPPLAVRIGHGIQRQAAGGEAMRTVACLPAVVGAYDLPGGGSLYSSSGTPKGYNLDRSRRPELGERPRTLTMTNLGRNLTELDDPPVEALIVYGANPMVSNPETELVRRGLEREDLFTVVIELYPTETAAYADLLLPSTMQHEHIEINDSYNHRYLQWNEPAVAAPGACLPHTEIFRRLAAAMGYDEPALFATDEELATDLLDSPTLADAGITLDRLRRHGHLPLPPRADPHRRPFPTPSGRFEFASRRAEADGHSLTAGYRPPAEAADAAGRNAMAAPGTDAPLALIAAASDQHVNSTFAGTDAVRRRGDDPPLVLHPDDAAARAVGPGDLVWVANDRGGFSAVVTVSDRTRRGVAATTKGWWHHGLNATVAERNADMADGAVFHDNAVRVERLD
ncbi:MAG: molybdopterin-dependent oxidoreductase, partial [Actinomycetota bacterium]